MSIRTRTPCSSTRIPFEVLARNARGDDTAAEALWIGQGDSEVVLENSCGVVRWMSKIRTTYDEAFSESEHHHALQPESSRRLVFLMG